MRRMLFLLKPSSCRLMFSFRMRNFCFRQRSLKMEALPCCGMRKAQGAGVKGLAWADGKAVLDKLLVF